MHTSVPTYISFHTSKMSLVFEMCIKYWLNYIK